MKNKKLVYILLPLVAVIWGVIFYKIYNQIANSDKNMATGMPLNIEKDADSLSDTFQLILNYRDPFLSYSFQHQMAKTYPNSLQRGFTKQATQNTEFQWPNFIYGGMIVNRQNKSKTGLLIYNNQSLLVKEGDINQGYKIIKLYNDSALIGYNKLRKTFNR
jgi:hypothetical protein